MDARRSGRRKFLFWAAAAAACRPAIASRPLAIPPFSTAPLGSAVAPGWEHQALPKVPQTNTFAIVEDGSRRVLRVQSASAASAWLARLSGDAPERPRLQWQWTVSRALAGSDLRSKQGDDYAARVYVLVDVPLERLDLADQLRLRAAGMLSDPRSPQQPSATSGGQAQPAGASGWNPYTDRVRMLVVDSGDTYAQRWRTVMRDVRADWQEAFGGAMPRISAVAVGADTDNTRDSVTAWFSYLSISAMP